MLIVRRHSYGSQVLGSQDRYAHCKAVLIESGLIWRVCSICADPASEQSWQKFAARLAVPSQPAALSSQRVGSVNAAGLIEQDRSGAPVSRLGLPADPDEDIFANAEPTDKPDRATQHSQSAAASPAFQLQDASPEDAGTGEEQDNLAGQGYRDSSPAHESEIDPMKLLEQQALSAAAEEPMQDIIMLGGSPEAAAPLRLGTLQQELHAKSAAGQQSLSAPTSGVPSGTHYESLQWEAGALFSSQDSILCSNSCGTATGCLLPTCLCSPHDFNLAGPFLGSNVWVCLRGL